MDTVVPFRIERDVRDAPNVDCAMFVCWNGCVQDGGDLNLCPQCLRQVVYCAPCLQHHLQYEHCYDAADDYYVY